MTCDSCRPQRFISRALHSFAGRLTRALTVTLVLFALIPDHLDAQPIQAVRLSVSSSGEQANSECIGLAYTRDFRHILFYSRASNLVPDDTNGVKDVFLRDRDTDTDGVFDEPDAVSTTRVSEGERECR